MKTFLFFCRKIGVVFLLPFVIVCLLFLTSQVYASGGESGGQNTALIFLWIAILLIMAKLSGLMERLGQPAVLGELLLGVILGNLTLAGISFFKPVAENDIIIFLAELGVVILLFQIGLESNIKKMRRVGTRAFLVAIVGVAAPFVLGAYVVGPVILPGLSNHTYLFLGAALTATSVGVTARVFRDLGILQKSEAQIVLGAAVIDDVLGLIILAIISAIVTVGVISFGVVGFIVFKAVAFLAGSIIVGQIMAPKFGFYFSKINTGAGMKFTLAISFGLFFSYLAQQIGLSPIVGAFAAGLVLDPVHFRFFKDQDVISDIKRHIKDVGVQGQDRLSGIINRHSKKHVEDLIEPLAHFFVPIFFITTGMAVKLETLFDTRLLIAALGITVVALIGKIISGFVAGKNVNKSVVGWGMVPRGEVGLIFATIGKTLGVIPDQVFSIIVVMVILTTLMTPLVLSFILKRDGRNDKKVSLARNLPIHQH